PLHTARRVEGPESARRAPLRGPRENKGLADAPGSGGHPPQAAGTFAEDVKEKAMKVTVGMVEEAHFRKHLPPFRVGDQVRAVLKIVEGDSERLQAFEGTVIRISGHGMSKMFTLRKVSFGVGVERSIPFHSPRLEKLEVMRSGHVRRSR